MPLDYNSGIGFEEATERLDEIEREFDRIKDSYSGFFGYLMSWGGSRMRGKDQDVLKNAIGVLLPLSLESSVKGDPATFDRLSNLNLNIQSYLSEFENTGVRKVDGSYLS